MSARGFCSDMSLARHEPLAGTGGHPERMLLLRWPKGGWDERFGEAPGMDPALRATLARLREGGRRVNLIDRKGTGAGLHPLYLFPEGLTRCVATAGLPDALARLEAGDLSDWEDCAGPVMLVCTHGRKDRCCAKKGYAAYRALRDAGAAELWESTHLGGCRFAGTALVLPQRRKYGRLSPSEAGALLASEARDAPYLPAFRGSCDLAAPAQVAEHAALAWAQDRGARPLGRPALRPLGADAFDVTLDLGTDVARLEVRCEKAALTTCGTCKALDAGEAEARDAWRAVSVECRADAGPPR